MNKKTNPVTSEQRESGIELLKIVAIFLIVISHVCQSVSQKPTQLSDLYPKLINLNETTENIQYLILAFFRHFGALGNHIFIACSFWFLSSSVKVKWNKVITMLGDIWVISMAFLFVYKCLGEQLPKSLITKSLFPTLYANNWFLTCYILIYMIHPYLNIIINSITQKTHAILCIISLALYCGVVFLKTGLLYYSNLVLFVILYFFIGYMRNYMQNWFDRKKNSWLILVIGLAGMFGMLLLTNYIGLHYSAYRNKLLEWNVNNNPFIIMTAVALFHLFRQLKFKNTCINYIAGCSLIIYIIHENILFRSFTRVRIWISLLERFGQDTILLQVLVYALVLLSAALSVSLLYQCFVHKIVKWAAKHVEILIVKLVDGLASFVVKLK